MIIFQQYHLFVTPQKQRLRLSLSLILLLLLQQNFVIATIFTDNNTTTIAATAVSVSSVIGATTISAITTTITTTTAADSTTTIATTTATTSTATTTVTTTTAEQGNGLKNVTDSKYTVSDIGLECAQGWEKYRSKCFRVYTVERSWPQALLFCSR
ncbi:lectin C-type domain-containing protein [Wuchereria bancrofti]|nr:lectin C-type domain-containing protein [Wuchereria bancrofti]